MRFISDSLHETQTVILWNQKCLYCVCLYCHTYGLLLSLASSQIYIFYGTRSNAEFVIHNGFFFEDNAHDRVKIKLGVSKSERLYAMKAEVLARAGIPS